jgi:serine/threonine protein kinase
MSMDEHGNSIDHPDFRVKEHLASGGMGAVLEVEEATTLRPVALKVMHPNAMQSEDARRRFMLEAQVMARLEHPNIVPMHVLKKDAEGKPFYTMKKVVGRDLQQILAAIRKGQQQTAADFPLARLLQVFQKICDAIGYAHSKGVVHRDLKPANVMVGEFGEVLVMDWGLAKIIGQDEVEPSIEDSTDLSAELSESQLANSDLLDVGAGLTMDGALMGTPQYMAPEQAEGRVNEIDGRTDVWALGGILYSILTLHPPVTGKSLEELLSKVRTGEIVSPTVFNSSRTVGKKIQIDPNFKLLHCPSRKVPSALAAIVQQAMQLDPDNRYPTAEDLRADVEAWQNGFTTAAEHAGAFKELGLLLWRNKLVTLGVVAILTLGTFFGMRVRASLAQTENALVELRSSIPLFIADIDGLVVAGDYEGAHERLDQCLRLIPDRSSFYLQKGRLYQSSMDFDAALEQFTKAVEFAPDDTEAMDEMAFTKAISQKRSLDKSDLQLLANRLMEAKRYSELSQINTAIRQFDENQAGRLEGWRLQMIANGATEEMANELKLIPEPSLALQQGDVTTLDFLKGIPIETLHVKTASAIDLSPLRGMPLKILRLRTPALTDIGPLKGMRLREFTLWEGRIQDFGVLEGMPLEKVEIESQDLTNIDFLANLPLTHVGLRGNKALADFTPLKGKKLTNLDILQTGATDLAFAKGMPLKNLNIEFTQIASVEDLAGAPLEILAINRTLVSDLSPLKGAPLGALGVSKLVSDLSPLEGAPLYQLWACGSKQLHDLSPLKNAKLRYLTMWGTSVSDLGPLSGQPIERLNLANTRVTDLRPLSGMPLVELQLQNCQFLSKLTGLETCDQLQFINVPKRQLNLDPIRNLPRLKKLRYGSPPKAGDKWARVPPVEEYWPAYDKWRRTRLFK